MGTAGGDADSMVVDACTAVTLVGEVLVSGDGGGGQPCPDVGADGSGVLGGTSRAASEMCLSPCRERFRGDSQGASEAKPVLTAPGTSTASRSVQVKAACNSTKSSSQKGIGREFTLCMDMAHTPVVGKSCVTSDISTWQSWKPGTRGPKRMVTHVPSSFAWGRPRQVQLTKSQCDIGACCWKDGGSGVMPAPPAATTGRRACTSTGGK